MVAAPLGGGPCSRWDTETCAKCPRRGLALHSAPAHFRGRFPAVLLCQLLRNKRNAQLLSLVSTTFVPWRQYPSCLPSRHRPLGPLPPGGSLLSAAQAVCPGRLCFLLLRDCPLLVLHVHIWLPCPAAWLCPLPPRRPGAGCGGPSCAPEQVLPESRVSVQPGTAPAQSASVPLRISRQLATGSAQWTC